MEYETIPVVPRRFYALHNEISGESTIQEVGTNTFQVVDTAEWLTLHRPVIVPEPAKAKQAKVTPLNGVSQIKRRTRRTKEQIEADRAAATASVNGHVPETATA
jgi:hypothetical protein